MVVGEWFWAIGVKAQLGPGVRERGFSYGMKAQVITCNGGGGLAMA